MTKQIELDTETINALRERGKKSLFFLAKGILGFDDLTDHIHKPVCRSLEKYKDNNRVLIVLPRDWFKSTIGSVAYPIWRAINNPNVRILVVQNSMSNARKKLAAIKQIFENHALFRALYKDILPRTGQTWSAECLTVNRTGAFPEGTFEAAGVGTAVTSRHYDLVIEDDTISPAKDDMTGVAQQPTQLEIEKAIGFHRLVHPLLLHPTKSQIVVIGTRWAVGDLIGWIIKNFDYTLISRAAREKDTVGKRVAIWDRFNDDVLHELEKTSGPYMFAALYLNDPTEAINQVFKRHWIKFYQNLPKSGLLYCTSVDPASAKQEESSDPDYTVVLTSAIDVNTGRIYIVDYTRERFNPGQTISAIFDHQSRYHPAVVKMEAISYQRTLGYWLRRRMDSTNNRFYVEEIKGITTSKIDRIRGLQPYFSAEQIAMRTHMDVLERELLAFPKGAHDDVIDALCMHIPFWNENIAAKEKERKEDEIGNPLSGTAIIDELVGRVGQKNTYPYDMGILGDTLVGRRQYLYA